MRADLVNKELFHSLEVITHDCIREDAYCALGHMAQQFYRERKSFVCLAFMYANSLFFLRGVCKCCFIYFSLEV